METVKKVWKKVLLGLGGWAIWWFFALTGLLHPIIGPIAAIFGKRGQSYAARLFNLDDRAGAVMFGYGGLKTLSWECGHSNSIPCRLICRAASFLLREENHCRQAAQGESRVGESSQ